MGSGGIAAMLTVSAAVVFTFLLGAPAPSLAVFPAVHSKCQLELSWKAVGREGFAACPGTILCWCKVGVFSGGPNEPAAGAGLAVVHGYLLALDAQRPRGSASGASVTQPPCSPIESGPVKRLDLPVC